MIGEYRDGFTIEPLTIKHVSTLLDNLRPEDKKSLEGWCGISVEVFAMYIQEEDHICLALLQGDDLYGVFLSQPISKDYMMVSAICTPLIQKVVLRAYPHIKDLLLYLMGDRKGLMALKEDTQSTELKLLKRFGFKIKSNLGFMKPGECLALLKKEDLCRYQR